MRSILQTRTLPSARPEFFGVETLVKHRRLQCASARSSLLSRSPFRTPASLAASSRCSVFPARPPQRLPGIDCLVAGQAHPGLLQLVTSKNEGVPAVHIKVPGARFTLLYSHGNAEDVALK